LYFTGHFFRRPLAHATLSGGFLTFAAVNGRRKRILDFFFKKIFAAVYVTLPAV
jgi:hypothetical protein